MRDIVLAALVGALLIAVFKHPVVGAYLWAWLSLMNPHKLTYGFAFRLPFAQAAAAVTLVMFLATKQKQSLPFTGVVVCLFAMVVWMSFTSLFAMADTDSVSQRWIYIIKMVLMLLVTWMLITDAKQLRVLIWIVTFSVCFFGIKGGVWTVLTGGGGRVWGPPGGMLEENNALAVALVMLTPILYFLRQTETNKWLRRLLLFSMVTVVFSILGSQSRGALLALLSMSLFLGLKGKYPVRTSLLIVLGVVIAISFMPDSWTRRMETLNTYEEDTSAMSRIWTWKTLWAAALDRPIVGVGFGADNLAVFSRYAPIDGFFAIFAGKVFVAHSIYLQMLGEHGFVGLSLFLGLGATTWFTASSIASKCKDDPEFGSWMPLLMRMVQVSLIGYAAGGAFLSLAYLDLPYYIIGFVVSCSILLRKRDSQIGKTKVVAPRQGAKPPGTNTRAPNAARRNVAER